MPHKLYLHKQSVIFLKRIKPYIKSLKKISLKAKYYHRITQSNKFIIYLCEWFLCEVILLTHAGFKEMWQGNTKCLNKQNFKLDFFEFGIAYLILEFRISPKQQQQFREASVCCNLKLTFRSLRYLFCKSGSLHHKKK